MTDRLCVINQSSHWVGTSEYLHKPVPSEKTGGGDFLSVSLNVLCRIIWVYLSVGVWVYPLLGHFSTGGLVGFFFFNMSVVTLLYVLGGKLNNHIWSETSGGSSARLLTCPSV